MKRAVILLCLNSISLLGAFSLRCGEVTIHVEELQKPIFVTHLHINNVTLLNILYAVCQRNSINISCYSTIFSASIFQC